MDHRHLNDIRARRQRRQAARALSDAAESDLAMRLLIGALILVLGGVVVASSLVQLGGFKSAELSAPAGAVSAAPALPSAETGGRLAGRPGACVRLADEGDCASRAAVADRLLAWRPAN